MIGLQLRSQFQQRRLPRLRHRCKQKRHRSDEFFLDHRMVGTEMVDLAKSELHGSAEVRVQRLEMDDALLRANRVRRMSAGQ